MIFKVTRAACQCTATVFLSLGRSMETDLEKIIKELLQKGADTNKFIRYVNPLIQLFKIKEYLLQNDSD